MAGIMAGIMAILHTVNKTPFERNSLESCLRYARPGSVVLLLEDGVYAAIRGTAGGELLLDAGKELRLFALGPDLAARGLTPERLVPGIDVVDYEGFVRLATQCHSVQSWL